MTTTPKRCIIWCRVSSEEQATDKKMSIPDQLTRQRERGHRNGWIVIDEIIVDGFSADYFTYAEFADDAAAHGFRDPQRMWEHWRNKDFDIVSCRDLSRLGRKQSIVNEFLERTIQAGATIDPLDEASVDLVNFRMSGAIAGLGAAEHLDKMKRGRNMGMIARASRGEKLTRRVPMFYCLDTNGKLQPDRKHFQRLFDDIADLFLMGTSYDQLPYQLESRGHVNPESGKRFDKSVIRRMLLTSRSWGHAEFNRTGRKRGAYDKRVELWVTGRTEPPADVFFKRDVCEPLWSGQQREDMIDELERRYTGIRGAARPQNTYALSRLCVCEVCGRFMAVQKINRSGGFHYYLACHNGRLHLKDCTNNRLVRFDRVEAELDRIIAAAMLKPDSLFADDSPPTRSRIPAIEKDIERLKTRYNNLIEIIQDALPAGRPAIQAKMNTNLQQQAALETERIRAANSEREAEYTRRQRVTALDTLRTVSVWSLPGTQGNQLLRKILGNRRLLCNDSAVTGLRVIG